MIADDLPLFELFTQLRRSGLPLGIDDYYLLLRALQAGFGIADQYALKRLCRTLWVKSLEDVALFDYQFEQVMAQPFISEPLSLSTKKALPESSKKPSEQMPQKPISTKDETKPTPVATSGITSKIDDEVQAFQAVPQFDSRDDIHYSQLILSDEYFPITRRQMKQCWRYLRRPVREGPPTVLDVEATVNEIGRQGIFFEPILIPERVNRAELLLLIDQGGSMVPFHALGRRLVETALRGGRLGKAGTYYFHNCPTEHLYRSSAHLGAEPVQNVLDQLHNERTGVLIFSDAGAARGGYSLDRIKSTKKFLERLKQQILYIAWLNPMPHSRWSSTTAEEIMHLVPMFDVSRRGLDEAIGILRGHPTSLEA